jgi:hypothetical protein
MGTDNAHGIHLHAACQTQAYLRLSTNADVIKLLNQPTNATQKAIVTTYLTGDAKPRLTDYR